MEAKGSFGDDYEENNIRSDCGLRIQGMSELCMQECVDSAWDDFLLDDDRVVPHNGSKRLSDHFTLGENNKRCRREIASLSNNPRGSATKCDDHRKENTEILPSSRTMDNMLEKQQPSGPFTSGSDNELIREASSLACDSAMPLPHGSKSNNSDFNSSLVDDGIFNFPIGDVNHSGNDLSFLGHAQNKESSDLLYYNWSEIENFDDIDRMFRRDSTLGIESCKDDLSWLSSADDVEGPGDAPKSESKFPCPNPSEVKTISENRDFSNGYSMNNFAMIDAPIGYKDCSWTSEKSDSYTSFLTGPDVEDSKDGFISPTEQGIGSNAKIQPRISTSSHFRSGNVAVIGEHKKQIEHLSRPERKNEVHCLENGSLAQISDLQSKIMNPCSGETFASLHVQKDQCTTASDADSCLENPISNMHAKDSHMFDPSSVDLESSIVKSETSGLASISSRDSHHGSSQLLYMGGFPGPPFKEAALAVRGQREKLKSCVDNLSSGLDSLEHGSEAVQASISDPGLIENFENHCGPQGISSATVAEIGSSNMQESSTMAPDLADISLEAASFRQLEHVTKQLDLRTKLCIRDSLYRLAHSAEQRRRKLNLSDSYVDERDAAGGSSEAEVTTSGFIDMETDTNPIDRSVAHLLFHRPSDSSNGDSFSLKSSSAVHGSVGSPPCILSDSLVSEEDGT